MDLSLIHIFGICGASGTGIQHVAAIMHEAGTGVSQTIGTGGNDCKDPVGGIMMLMGIDALEADPETKYIALITRKPGETVLPKVLARIKTCKKPVVEMCIRDRCRDKGHPNRPTNGHFPNGKRFRHGHPAPWRPASGRRW